ncbi:hypothetical protein [Caulobacter endophyticus]|uniref:hypothetical protein n=1 Tax=Caulobacter endophyticus TaxID=2172652 RepID=UPI0011B2641B|nr:hypothetical protein [Caulobacter endophyticus]
MAFAMYLAILGAWLGSGFNKVLPPYAEALTTATLGEIFSPTGIYLAAFVSMMGVGKFAAGLAAGAAASQALVFWTGRPLPVFHK